MVRVIRGERCVGIRGKGGVKVKEWGGEGTER